MKAILVIDMPNDCVGCNQFVFECCHTMRRDIDKECITQIKRPSWCPVKPIHALKSAGKDYIIYERQYLYENLEREYELLKEAREYESNTSC